MQNTPDHTVESILSTKDGYYNFVAALFNRSEDESKNFAHAILGVTTECDELLAAKDFTNAIEEFGDMGFYIVAAMQVATRVLGIGTKELKLRMDAEVEALQGNFADKSVPDLFREMRTSVEDHAKRWVGYGKRPPLIGALVEVCLLATAAVNLSLLAHRGGQDNQDTAERANVAKLLERYKGVTFSAEAAMNRDTAAERAVLEQHAA